MSVVLRQPTNNILGDPEFDAFFMFPPPTSRCSTNPNRAKPVGAIVPLLVDPFHFKHANEPANSILLMSNEQSHVMRHSRMHQRVEPRADSTSGQGL